MPDLTITPLNQCIPDDPSDGADMALAPTEPARPAFINPLDCFDQTPGAEGSGGTDCTEQLVRHHEADGCVDETLRAAGSCGALVLAAGEKRPIEVALALTSCLGAMGALLQCEAQDDAVH
jgi:hypothetical protein